MQVIALTDKGRVRAVNQDSYYQPRPGEQFAVIADGMGGHRAGDIASRMAVEEFTRWLKCAPRPDEETLRYAVSEANRAVYNASRVNPDYAGMGTTITALWFSDEMALLTHIGDSRAYRLRDGVLRQMSRDHTLVAELVASGAITAEEAKSHPQRHYITRALGTSNRVEADITCFSRKKDDVWLLCTDGLTNYIEPRELETALKGRRDWREKAQSLVSEALTRGGSDNITLMLVFPDGGVL